MTPRLLAVPDTNVWIDLRIAGLIDEAFHLDIDWVAPDIVIEELHEPEGADLVTLGLVSHELDEDGVRAVLALAVGHDQLSIADTFALVTATVLDAVLITGDRHLRRAATEQGVTVHGVLWVLDEMLGTRLISPGRAAGALRRMLANGSRPPARECIARLKEWERS